MRVKVGGKAIPASFLKIEEKGTLVGAIGRREGQTEELVGGQNPGPEAPPRSKEKQEEREQRRCQERSDCQRSDEERWVRQSFERKGVGRNDPVEYFLSAGVGSAF